MRAAWAAVEVGETWVIDSYLEDPETIRVLPVQCDASEKGQTVQM